MKRVIVAAGLAIGALLVGCMIVTGSTEGYSQAERDAGEAGLDLTCVSNADCAYAQQCCLLLQIGSPVCKGDCSDGIQLCHSTSECNDGGPTEAGSDAAASADDGGIACIKQTCSFPDQPTVTFSACGLIPVAACVAR